MTGVTEGHEGETLPIGIANAWALARRALMDDHRYADGSYADTHPAMQDRIDRDIDEALAPLMAAVVAELHSARRALTAALEGGGNEEEKNGARYTLIARELVAQLTADWSEPVRLKVVEDDGRVLKLIAQSAPFAPPDR
jgi:hypothetical protein